MTYSSCISIQNLTVFKQLFWRSESPSKHASINLFSTYCGDAKTIPACMGFLENWLLFTFLSSLPNSPDQERLKALEFLLCGVQWQNEIDVNYGVYSIMASFSFNYGK